MKKVLLASLLLLSAPAFADDWRPDIAAMQKVDPMKVGSSTELSLTLNAAHLRAFELGPWDSLNAGSETTHDGVVGLRKKIMELAPSCAEAKGKERKACKHDLAMMFVRLQGSDSAEACANGVITDGACLQTKVTEAQVELKAHQ